jgi:hypothetical protein
MDRILRVARHLVRQGIVVDDNENDCAEEIARMAQGWDLMQDQRKHSHRSMFSTEEQKHIVRVYAEYAKTTNDPLKRSAKIRSLGVGPETMCHWARKHFGPGHLDSCRPTPTLRLIIEELQQRPWQNRLSLIKNAGVVKTSLPGALSWGRLKGKLKRRKGKKGLYEWALK